MDHSPGFLHAVEKIKPLIQEITIFDYQKIVSQSLSHVLIDVREDHEWQLGHIVNAVHIGRGVLERDIEQKIPNKHTKLILYCGGGFRSALATFALQSMGYRDVSSMDGGYRAWSELKLAISLSEQN